MKINMRKLEEFMKNEIPSKINKQEALAIYKDEIVELREKGYAYVQIAKYLNSNYRLKTCRTSVATFLKGEIFK